MGVSYVFSFLKHNIFRYLHVEEKTPSCYRTSSVSSLRFSLYLSFALLFQFIFVVCEYISFITSVSRQPLTNQVLLLPSGMFKKV